MKSWGFYKFKYARSLMIVASLFMVSAYIMAGVGIVAGFASGNTEGVVMGSLVGVYAGAGAFTGQINSPCGRIGFHIDGAADADVNGLIVTITQATKKKTGTLIPAVTVAVLREICGFLDGASQFDTTLHTCDFSIPIALNGGAYDPEGGSITVGIANQIAACTTTIYAIDDVSKTYNYTEIIPIAAPAGGVQQLDLTGAVAIFMGAANITRVKLVYDGKNSVEYLPAEIQEIARMVNPTHLTEGATGAEVLFMGYNLWLGLNVIAAIGAEVTLTAAGMIYVVKNELAA